MNGRRTRVWKLGAVIALVAVAACRKDRGKGPAQGDRADEALVQRAIDSARMEAERAAAAAPSELAGSTWRLVQLQSSNDSVYAPEPKAVYTVEFGTDGRVSVVGGCNRGSGTYTVTPPSGLTFGPLATTRAMCPPGSMSARFLRDFQYMRSYVMVGGRLHISLMADGGIYEFAPEEDITAQMGAGDVAREVIFACSDSTGARSRIFARFAGTRPDKVTLRLREKTAVAHQVQSGSGARYEGSGVMFWNKGRDAMVTWRGANLNCATTRE